MDGTAPSNAKELLQMFLYAPVEGSGFNVPVPNRSHLHKQIFRASRRIPGTRFEGGRHGPFSKELAAAEDEAVSEGTVERNSSDGLGEMSLTEAGIKAAEELWSRPKEKATTVLCAIKELMNDMSYIELVSSIYTSDPEMAQNAGDQELYKKYRVEAAVSLVIKRKITVARGSEIAGMPQADFTDMLYENKIYVFAPEEEDVLKCIQEFKGRKGELASTIKDINRLACANIR
ncbi:MAG: UPF0175 family protein [Nitrosopumilus sp.]|nr:UPF0175 family protein [Nitrosopumilus sp.]MDA7998986.1 UPF0175 family protein [Nitrosopumilus sp.]